MLFVRVDLVFERSPFPCEALLSEMLYMFVWTHGVDKGETFVLNGVGIWLWVHVYKNRSLYLHTCDGVANPMLLTSTTTLKTMQRLPTAQT